MLAATTITALHSYINTRRTSNQTTTSPPPLPIHILCSSNSRTSSWRLSVVDKEITRSFNHRASNITRKRIRVLVKSGGGYIRKPLETPGAYQLIDQESGDKVIVWGGTDDDDSSIPSKELLSWKPSNKKNSTGGRNRGGERAQTAAEGTNSGDSTVRRMGLGGNFGRLKTQKVSSLIRKVTQIKRAIAENESQRSALKHSPYDRSSFSDLVSEHVPEEASISSQPEEIRDRFQHDETMLSRNNSDTNAKSSGNTRPRGKDFEENEPNAFVPRSGAGSSLRGWGRSPPAQNSSFDLTAYSKQKRKESVDTGFFSRKSFKDLGCTDDMIEALRGQLLSRPSHIQAMAFAPVIEGKTCVIADQSGSGKTLAYLSPVIQRLRQEELQGLGRSSSGSPSVVILAPTAELASQILNNCRSISKFGVPFRSMVATGGFRQKTQLESLQQDLDVLIATPGRFMFLLNEGFLQLTNLKCAVLDEVDILFGDEDFQKVLQSFVKSAPVSTQYIFVTATLPVEVYNKVVEVFPDSEVIMGPGMHRTSSKLEEVLVDCSGDDRSEKTPETAFLNKKSALLELLERTPVPKTIVFCNKIETCRKVENVLNRFDRKGLRIRVLPFHSALAQESRLSNLKSFNNSQSDEESLFLICTDRASRGIDFTAVDHVVLFDFPREPSEYVRRVGRTARGAGGKGKAFVFVVGKQVSLAQRIMERNLKGHPLHDVPTAY